MKFDPKKPSYISIQSRVRYLVQGGVRFNHNTHEPVSYEDGTPLPEVLPTSEAPEIPAMVPVPAPEDDDRVTLSPGQSLQERSHGWYAIVDAAGMQVGPALRKTVVAHLLDGDA